MRFVATLVFSLISAFSASAQTHIVEVDQGGTGEVSTIGALAVTLQVHEGAMLYWFEDANGNRITPTNILPGPAGNKVKTEILEENWFCLHIIGRQDGTKIGAKIVRRNNCSEMAALRTQQWIRSIQV